jgi:hypothetical protein
VNSKYAKYSTEQLEVILTHLSDHDEKELVKKELSQRYYQHYLGIINTPEDQLQPGSEVGPLAKSEEDQAETEEAAGCDELAAIQEVGPITLTPPAGPEAAAGLAAKPTDKTAKKKYCFIATAAYGSPLAREVVLLQNYRDDYLAQNPLGEKFIRAYYRLSPQFARWIRRSNILRFLTRCFLAPLILLIKNYRSSGPAVRI